MAVRTNRITNPAAGTNTTLTTANGSATVTRVTNQSYYSGTTTAFQVAASLANAGLQWNTYTVGVGVQIVAAVALKWSSGATDIVVELRNQANTVIASSAVTLTTTWQLRVLTGTTPAATTSVHVRTNRVAAASHTYFAVAFLEQAAAFTDIFTGASIDDLINDYAWTGTTHLSTSTATENEPITVTAYQTADPSPRVEIVLPTVPVAGVTTTVERIYSGKRSVVRGALRSTSISGFTVTDYEAPLNVPITYQATSYNVADGIVAMSPISPSVTLVESGVRYAWLSDPLSPTAAVKATMEAATGDELGYDAPMAVLAAMGRRYPIAVMGTRLAASGVPLTLYTATNGEGNTVRDIVTQAAPLCVRPATTNRLPALFYLAAKRITEKPYLGGPRVWDLTGDIVAAPSGAVVVPLHTYAEVHDGYATYAALDAAKATYLEVLRDPV